MKPLSKRIINRRVVGNNVWLEYPGSVAEAGKTGKEFAYTVLDNEDAVGRAMFDGACRICRMEPKATSLSFCSAAAARRRCIAMIKQARKRRIDR